MLLYSNIAMLNSIAVFNHSTITCIAQLVALAASAAIAAKAGQRATVAFTAATGVAGSFGITMLLFSTAEIAHVAGAILCGCGLGALMLAWGAYLAEQHVRDIARIVLTAFALGSLLCWVCTALPSTAYSAILLVLPVGSAACLVQTLRTKPQPQQNEEAATAYTRPITKLMLTALCACSVTGSLFFGMALSPFAFQSASVPRYISIFATAAFVAPLLWLIVSRKPLSRLLLIAPPVLLMVGLFLLSSGLTGSIIMPLGMVMAAATCCIAVCWIALAEVAKRPGSNAITVIGLGLLLCTSTLPCNVGILVNRFFDFGFSQIALAASVAVVALSLFYVIASTAENNLHHSEQPQAAANAEGEKQTLDDSATQTNVDFTQQELRIAHLIMKKMTYAQIAETCGISQSTVKFHCKNLFEKTDSVNRREFEAKVVAGSVHLGKPE